MLEKELERKAKLLKKRGVILPGQGGLGLGKGGREFEGLLSINEQRTPDGKPKTSRLKLKTGDGL